MSDFELNTSSNEDLPYESMLADFLREAREFKKKYKIDPNFILINPGDYVLVIKEMYNIGVLPQRKNEQLKINGLKLVQTMDIQKGSFEVVGK